MTKSRIFNLILSSALTAVFAAAVSAQNAPISGKVQLKKADGTITPVAGALVEVYRMDVKATFPSDKTDKKGNFSFAGLPLGGSFVLSVSAPGASPNYLPGVKPGAVGTDKLVITLEEGDGRRWTEQELRTALASAPAAGSGEPKLTEEQKKQIAEQEKKIAEIKAKNAEIENKNTLVQKALQDGNAAYEAKDYATALARYTDGINADPAFIGSVPVFAANKAIVLRERAILSYNNAIKPGTDANVKIEGFNSAKKDLADAIDVLAMAWNLIKNATAEDQKDSNFSANKTRIINTAKSIVQYMVRTEQVDPEKIPTAKALMDDYVAIETDAAKKTEAKLAVADIYRVTVDSDKAIEGYKEVLAIDPENVDALAGVGLSLVNKGYIANDKAALQEGANYLQKFVSVAPATHRYKDDAQSLIESLKAEQNVTPQKTSGGGKKKP
ncbi:MAG: carboxypeptidase regulatory-like domain-containing protein [Pyrinomonadaceae bacterium]